MRGLRVRAMVVQSREAEVAEPPVHVAVQKHVARLDVPVDDDLLPVLVHVQQAGGNAFDDPEPLSPVQSMAVPVQVFVEAAIWHVIVYQQQLPFTPAIAEQLNEVAMPEPADAYHLRDELPHPLPRLV